MKERSFANRKTRRRILKRERKVESVGTQLKDMPEPILVHILSFLPTRDAVKTSLVAKSWKCLWKSVTNLCFDEEEAAFTDDEKDENMRFFDFVDRVLSLRDSSNIFKFSMKCNVYDETRFPTWLSTAVDQKVQVLELDFLLSNPYVFPPSLFTCDSLTELDINLCEDLLLPSNVVFRCLKIFTLANVTFVNVDSFHQLFSGCFVLEKLTLVECNWNGIGSVCISIPTLKNLDIHESPERVNNCQIAITGKNILVFDYVGDLENEYNLYDLSSLVESYIDLGSLSRYVEWGRQLEVASRAHKLVKGISHARDLCLSYGVVEVLNHTPEFFSQFSVYNNLTFLVLFSGSVDFNCIAMQSLLHNAPSLTILDFDGGVTFIRGNKNERELRSVPPCFLTQLKTVLIRDFTGTPAEMVVVDIFQNHAQGLDRLCVRWRDNPSNDNSGQSM